MNSGNSRRANQNDSGYGSSYQSTQRSQRSALSQFSNNTSSKPGLLNGATLPLSRGRGISQLGSFSLKSEIEDNNDCQFSSCHSA